MKLPYDALAGDRPRARLEARGPDYSFDTGWGTDNTHVFPLDQNICEASGGDCNVRFSVVSNQTNIDRLLVRVTFCDDECDADASGLPSLWYTIAEPFQTGRRTFWNASAEPFVRVPDTQPSTPAVAAIEIPKCEIRDECWPADVEPETMFGFCNEAMQRFCE